MSILVLGIVLLDLTPHVFVGSTNGIVVILETWVFRFILNLFSFFDLRCYGSLFDQDYVVHCFSYVVDS